MSLNHQCASTEIGFQCFCQVEQIDLFGCNIASKEPKSDPVNRPSHYNQGRIEVIDFILDQKLSFLAGQIIKYVSRYSHKGSPLVDLQKADFYLKRLIQQQMEATDRG